MYLKKLEIFGFKSFMNKLQVEFGEGLTGVIGPNGCGKSNISDAIRWVLGEQNARLLRGETMDDVIFNGTRNRKPLGMAEVSLTISNASHMFPIDYSEIRVTRRVYRSGVSEYLINKSPCRLKDVKNLFMDTGLGNSSYTLLERNMVDNLLNNTSANLRFMLEEAAGIMKYKTQEKIAVRKLDATENDLLRIRDIVSEVEKRVRSLKRQIGKAQRHNELTAEMRDLIRRTGVLELRRLRGEETERNRLREEASRKMQSSSGRVAGVEAEIESHRLGLREREEELKGAQEALDETEGRIEKIQSESLVLGEREKGLHERQERIEREIEERNQRIRETVELHWKKSEEEEEATREIRRFEGELETKRGENSILQERVGRAKKQLLERKQITLDLFRGESEKRNVLGNLETQLHDLTERGGELETRIGSLEEEERGLSVRSAEAEEAFERASTDAQRLRAERNGAEENLERTRARRNEVGESLVLHQGKRESLESTLRFLLKLQSEYEGYRDGVRSLLTENPAPGSVLGVVGELIEVDPPEMLPAFENVLGEALQCVLVREEGEALDLLRFLRENEKGWVSLVPQDRFRGALPETPAELLGEEGVIGTAERYVRGGDGLRDVIRFLLADVVFVRDLGTARRLARDGRYRDFRFVTPSGEGAAHPGFLFGGRSSREGVGLFERRSRIAELESELKEASIQLGDLIEAKRKLEETFTRSRDERDRIIVDLDRAQSRVEEDGRERARLRTALENARESLGRTREERDRIAGQAEEVRRRLDAVHSEVVTIGADGSEADRSLREIEAEMVELEMKREEGSRLLGQAQVNLAEAEGRKKSLEAEVTSLARWERELGDEISRRREEQQANRGSLEEIAERLASLGREEAELASRREEETTRRDEILGEVNRAGGEIRRLEDSVREDRRLKEESAEELHRQEMRLQEIRLQRENLLERTDEELGERIRETDELPHAEGDLDETEMRARIGELRDGLRRLGPVNLVALDEFDEENERYEFLRGQEEDLVHARDSLKETIRTVDTKARGLFMETFEKVRSNFHETFTTLFEGGEADLRMADPDNPLLSELEIVARPGQKRPQKIALLSGGERALTAIAILFALYLEKPSPFCILDELDAPLDEANVGRFLRMLERFREKTQFVIITHNRQTMEGTDYLYGVTMEESGVSRVVSVRLGGKRLSAEEEAERIEMIETQQGA
ncbi:MAG: chromosome segregation protein SMC [Candidatus Eisenbacteria bacterium]|nr:chromosome segregation protein SMC [Candidatus Eisenbacteria bacterium]